MEDAKMKNFFSRVLIFIIIGTPLIILLQVWFEHLLEIGDGETLVSITSAYIAVTIAGAVELLIWKKRNRNKSAKTALDSK